MKKVQAEPCPTCGKPFHWRRKRMLAGLTSNKLGRPRTRPDKDILKLREKGFSMREIAYRLKTSTGSVQRAIKAAGL